MLATINTGGVDETKDIVLAFLELGRVEEAETLANSTGLIDQIPELRRSADGCDCDLCRGYALGEIET